MKNYIFGAVLALGLVASPAASYAAGGLTSAQVESIINLLQAFNADAATIANVRTSLNGGTPSVPPPAHEPQPVLAPTTPVVVPAPTAASTGGLTTEPQTPSMPGITVTDSSISAFDMLSVKFTASFPPTASTESYLMDYGDGSWMDGRSSDCNQKLCTYTWTHTYSKVPEARTATVWNSATYHATLRHQTAATRLQCTSITDPGCASLPVVGTSKAIILQGITGQYLTANPTFGTSPLTVTFSSWMPASNYGPYTLNFSGGNANTCASGVGEGCVTVPACTADASTGVCSTPSTVTHTYTWKDTLGDLHSPDQWQARLLGANGTILGIASITVNSPKVVIAAPVIGNLNGYTTSPNLRNITGTGFAQLGNTVEFWRNGTIAAAVSAAGSSCDPLSAAACQVLVFTYPTLSAGTYAVDVKNAYGQSAPVSLVVSPVAAAAAAVPTASLSQSASSAVAGTPFTVTLTSTNATYCKVSYTGPDGGGVLSDGPTNGSMNFSTMTVGTYTGTATCTGPGGTVTSAAAQHTVTAASAATIAPTASSATTTAPTTASAATASPAATLSQSSPSSASGTSYSVSLSATNVTSCVVSYIGPDGSIGTLSSGPTSGTLPLATTGLGTYTASATCSGANGTVTSAPIQHTVTPAPPTASLSQSSVMTTSGGAYTVTLTSTNAASCVVTYIGPDGGGTLSNGPTSGSLNFNSTIIGSYTATATCSGPGGTGTASATHTVAGVLGASIACTDLGRNMHRGAETEDVTSLQDFLRDWGTLSVASSGFYGDHTVAAVKAYQESKGLPVTGMVYALTRAAIRADSCH